MPDTGGSKKTRRGWKNIKPQPKGPLFTINNVDGKIEIKIYE